MWSCGSGARLMRVLREHNTTWVFSPCERRGRPSRFNGSGRAVSGGWRPSIFALGSLLKEQGDREGAVEMFEMGAQQECELSQDALAQLALKEETEESYRVARYWAEKAAQKGYAPAQVTLGQIFHEGLGVDRNPERAMRWFLQAAKQGHDGAQAMIGVAAHLGIGVEADRFHAVRMLMLSAAQGNRMAKAYLPTVFDELTPD